MDVIIVMDIAVVVMVVCCLVCYLALLLAHSGNSWFITSMLFLYGNKMDLPVSYLGSSTQLLNQVWEWVIIIILILILVESPAVLAQPKFSHICIALCKYTILIGLPGL